MEDQELSIRELLYEHGYDLDEINNLISEGGKMGKFMYQVKTEILNELSSYIDME